MERGKPDKNFAYVDFGNSPGDAMVCNYFLWYTNALYNFIGVFKKAFSPSEDLEAEFANVITWRHKVSAHTSWVWPHRDNAATQDMSILLFPEFNFQFDGDSRLERCRLHRQPVAHLVASGGGSCSRARAAEGDC